MPAAPLKEIPSKRHSAVSLPKSCEKRNGPTAHVFVTENYFWNTKDGWGKKDNFQINVGECFTLPAWWQDKVSSIGPDQGLACTIYDKEDCAGNFYGVIQKPGIESLPTINWNDKVVSVSCIWV
ncbi:hypothetical protein QBC35DRAFT_454957 [Podospora australis]|uniref:Uncharacterized protein n=1 Tax=Podospora australis TaxID=1536484 RepID=A0AAN6WNX8_9PEZI|nr:hypothetical protein QBC35DRAFT_454957 [Podospora australis]